MIVYQVTDFLSASIFSGACTVTFLSIIIYAFKRNIPINRTVLTQAVNITLLASALLGLVSFVFSCFKAFHNTEYGRYVLLNRFFGPYWWAACVMFSIWVLLPQVLWFRRARRLLGCSIAIISLQLLFKLMLFAIQLEVALQREYSDSGWAVIPTISVVDYLEHVGVYVVILVGIYYGMQRFRVTSHSSSGR